MTKKTADQLAMTEKLTLELLLKVVAPNCSNDVEVNIICDIAAVACCYDLSDEIIIYCFIRLWEEGKVKNLDFVESFLYNGEETITDYTTHYQNNLRSYQDKLW